VRVLNPLERLDWCARLLGRTEALCRRGLHGLVVLVVLSAALLATAGHLQAREPTGRIAAIDAADLPSQARDTIALIRKRGPYPYRKDGTVFGNFEKRLPLHSRGYYREYTVPTPGARDRGARRIVAGKAGELYYSDDHYHSFKRVQE
jgi:ribonuclease T1